MFYIEIYRENLKNLLRTNWKPSSLDIKYEALPSGLLQSLFKSWPWGLNWPCPGDHMFYIEKYRGKINNSWLNWKP